MSNQKTVYVIGAGASREVDMPDGIALCSDISEVLKSDYSNGRMLDEFIGDLFDYDDNYLFSDLRNKAELISKAMPLAISIDNFIENHKNDMTLQYCSKLAIVHTILASEKESLLRLTSGENVTPQIDYSFLQNNKKKEQNGAWLLPFFQLLTEKCIYNEDGVDIKDGTRYIQERLKNLTLIIFNYDRCVEHFLYYAFQQYFNIDESQAIELVETISIYHPYGVAGALPWQHKKEINNGLIIDFGAQLTTQKLRALSNEINTFSEREKATVNKNTANKALKDAKRIIFLGFAYHPMNMELLHHTLDNNNDATPEIYGTAYNSSKNDKNIIKINLHKLRKKMNGCHISSSLYNTNLFDGTCFELFSEYWRSLGWAE